LHLRLRVKLLAGKVRRCYLGVFRRGYIRANVARRRGECRRCGACCQLAFRCGALQNHEHVTACQFHKYRPLNCRVFPIDERDLADRDLIAPDQPCGFRFDDNPEEDGNRGSNQ
jgi:hypothetical protein